MLLVLLLHGLVLDVRGLLLLVDRGVVHELVVLLLRLCLRLRGLRLKPGKVRLDFLQHPDHPATLALHARVRLVEDLRLLEERRGHRRLSIELPQNSERLRNRGLRLLRVLDRLRVLRLLLLPNRCGRRHCLVKSRNRRSELGNLLRQLRDRGLQLIDLGMENLHALGLLLPGLLVGGELGVAPALVLGLLVRLLHQLHDEIFDHLLDFLERIRGHANRKRREHTAADLARLVLQVSGNAKLVRVLDHSTDLNERALLGLHERREVLVGGTGDRVAAAGLNPGETVVVDGVGFLGEGLPWAGALRLPLLHCCCPDR